MKTRFWHLVALVLIVFVGPSCVGISRSWTAGCAENIGTDWVIVQYRVDGTPFHCWKLHGVGVTNEPHSDGIYWKDSTTGHLVHISGWYNRVQVASGDYETAAKALGVTAAQCDCGEYPKP